MELHAGQMALARCIAELAGRPAERDQAAMWTIHSAAGLLDPEGNGWPRWPVRFPHPSAMRLPITGEAGRESGGGEPAGVARPGELTLAHEGVLIVDQLGDWDEAALDAVAEAAERGETEAGGGRLPARVLVAAIVPGSHEGPMAACREACAWGERIGRIFQIGAWVGRRERETTPPGRTARDVREQTLQRRIGEAEQMQEARYGPGGRNGTAQADRVYAGARLTAKAARELKRQREREGAEAANPGAAGRKNARPHEGAADGDAGADRRGGGESARNERAARVGVEPPGRHAWTASSTRAIGDRILQDYDERNGVGDGPPGPRAGWLREARPEQDAGDETEREHADGEEAGRTAVETRPR